MIFPAKPLTTLPVFVKWLWLPLFLLVLVPEQAEAQSKQRVVQLSGFVATGDSLYGVAGAGVYVPGTNRGTYTNEFGYFSLPVLAGDSVLFDALGFKAQYLIIPKNYSSQSYSIIMQMQEEPTELPTVDVFPWPTERDFKEAVANVKLPDKGNAILTKNLDPRRLEELARITPMSGTQNFRFWQEQQVQHQQNRIMAPTVNMMAIPGLLRSLLNGDFKQNGGR
ncbi:carboxypeptidase-like regulatory domain-containing protein [Pontibacter mangrovi]|uniref:Carboxypeptidase-like regulatory domain-containing protein n=1 Tax=Pontibacter mangrovi TaxID=2589816 RepID=A0A501WEC0_9BACT|nr:carboxypeptidase-like regulatory domain-containing protein [Pontibacter mangrovi]TPE43886.1 carboxypeptidase-like regulatory domain-containing protein [Pontibacter mangrovi]